MLKRFLILFSFFALAVTYYFVRQDKTQHNADIQRGWKKYSKKNNKTTFSHGKTIDLEQHKVPVVVRKPASMTRNKSPMRSGRYLEGQNAKKYTSPTEALSFKNLINPKWKDTLGHNLTRFQPEGTEVLIKKERGLIFVKENIGHYREQVLISYKLVDGRKSSYRAMIDSSNGKIIYTYDRTINEDFRRKPAGLSHPLAQ